MSIRAVSAAALAIGLLGGLIACMPARGPSDPAIGGGSPGYVSSTSYAEPGSSASALAAPTHFPPDWYSGSSTPPQTRRTVSRRTHHRQTTGRHRYEDLDEGQMQTQWINPPPGAGE